MLRIVLFFTLYAQVSFAQTTIRFVDGDTQFSVENAFVFIKGDSTSIHSYITNSAGEIYANAGTQFIVQVRHLNYLPFTDTLTTNESITLALIPNYLQLREVVVTGQHQPHSADNSIYRVRTITKDRIKNQGAVTLDDVLKTELNVRLSQDLAIGNTGISLQGIGGQNVKILVNGVPLVNRNGNGNDADLSQLNLQDVEKIEIVEGPMAVNYGANALAGVINIITNKSSASKAEINANMQEESAGSEYGFRQGRHVQQIGVKYNLSPTWYGKLNVSKNNFLGYQGLLTGRQKEWNPKDQWVTSALIKHSIGKHTLYYQLDYLNEEIINKGQQRESISPQGQRIPFAFDEKYKTQRITHQVQADGKLGQSFYNLVFSYSDFERLKRRFSKNLFTSSETLTTADGDQDTTKFAAWVMRGTVNNNIRPELSIQTGYDLNLESAGGGRIKNGQRSINDVGFFSSAEWLPAPSLKLRPGLRYAINSVYKTPILPSLNLKYSINEGTAIRAAYGRGYRSPSLRELYFEFVDSNHKIFGNDKLKPEYSHHYDLYVTKEVMLATHRAELTGGVFFNDMHNQITFMQSASDATVVTYFNILKYKTIGFTAEQKFDWNNLSTKLGLAYTGRYNQISESDSSSSIKTFFFSPEITGNFSYQFESAKIKLNLFYKYTGKLRNYVATDANTVSIGKLADYHWIDLTVLKNVGNNFTITAGIKNLLNIQRLNNSGQSGSTHTGGSSLPVSYGRSFFLSINYLLTIKKHDKHF